MTESAKKLKEWRERLEGKRKAIGNHGVVKKKTLQNLKVLLEKISNSNAADDFLRRGAKGLCTMVDNYLNETKEVDFNDVAARLDGMVRHIDEMLNA